MSIQVNERVVIFDDPREPWKNPVFGSLIFVFFNPYYDLRTSDRDTGYLYRALGDDKVYYTNKVMPEGYEDHVGPFEVVYGRIIWPLVYWTDVLLKGKISARQKISDVDNALYAMMLSQYYRENSVGTVLKEVIPDESRGQSSNF